MRALALAAVLTCGSGAGAQDRAQLPPPSVLPRDVAREVVGLFNATSTLRATSRTTIDSGRIVRGDVAVLNGPLYVAGHVTGRVLAVNSDVILRAGAQVDGDVLVVGGEVDGANEARIGGELRVYHPPLRYSQQGDLLVAENEVVADEQWWRRWERRGRDNYNRLEIANAGVYNRVEGLPVRVGPVLYRDQGWGHLRVDATAVLRTASSFTGSEPDVGHDVRGEFRVGRQFGVSVGARLFDVVEAIEEWQLGDAEVGLATFLFHRDYRDYFARHGGQLKLALRATESADLTLRYGDERWRSRDSRNPFTLSLDDVAWRENPRVDDGRMHVANLTMRVDTRNDVFNPFAGWYLLADVERGSGSFDAPGPTSTGVRGSQAGAVQYQRGFLDIRRYNRMGPTTALNLRFVLAGWLSGDALPLERRFSIDGPGTVPGFDFREVRDVDVGTCALGSAPAGRPAQCERISLAQLEYRSDIRLSFSDGAAPSRRNRFRADGAWVFFVDAGRGWLVNSPGSPLNEGRHEFPSLSSYRTDIGGGLDFERFGVYAAKALSEPSSALNVFVRIQHRF